VGHKSEEQSAAAIADALTSGHLPIGSDPFAGPPGGYPVVQVVPAADVDPAEIPKQLLDLNTAVNRSYDLSLTRAGDLDIPVVGSAGGSTSRRVVVLERTAFKSITGASGAEYQFGYAIRLCVTVDKWDVNAKLTLPFLAASAQIGQVQASWTMQVLGLAGPAIDGALAPPTELNVETFVIAKQSLTALIAAVNDPTTRFAAARLAVITEADARERALRIAAAETFGLARLARRAPLADTLRRFDGLDAELVAAIEDVYEQLGAGDGERPADAVALRARGLLGRVDADV